MGLNRDKFRRIVGGITTAEAETPQAAEAEKPVSLPEVAEPLPEPPAHASESTAAELKPVESETPPQPRFARRGRPKGRKEEPASKGRKVKVSLFLSELLVNDLYNWAHDDRIHPGEMFERALKPFHDKETKRRNGGKE